MSNARFWISPLLEAAPVQGVKRGTDDTRPVCGHGDGGTRRHGTSKSLPLSQIADAQRLPLPYTRTVVSGAAPLRLDRQRAPGRAGGYRLSRDAAQITIADVMAAVEEETHFTRCLRRRRPWLPCRRALHYTSWRGLSDATSGYPGGVTLADVTAGTLPKPFREGRRRDSAGGSTRWSARVYLDYNATAPLQLKPRPP